MSPTDLYLNMSSPADGANLRGRMLLEEVCHLGPALTFSNWPHFQFFLFLIDRSHALLSCFPHQDGCITSVSVNKDNPFLP